VLAGPSHDRRLVEQLQGQRDRARRDGDPLRTVEGIYSHFGIELTDTSRAAIEASHAESKKGPRAPKHTYSLEDYGLTAVAVKERFKGL
jgi:hypothetical protein